MKALAALTYLGFFLCFLIFSKTSFFIDTHSIKKYLKVLSFPLSDCARQAKNLNSKGQSPLLSHTIMLAFSLLLVLVIISMLTAIRDDYSNFIGKNEIAEVCLILKGGIEKMMTDDSYVSPTNTTKGRLFMRFPARIADQNYRMRFANNSVFVETLAQPRINDTCRLGHNASYTGSTAGGITEVNYTMLDSAAKIIAMKKV